MGVDNLSSPAEIMRCFNCPARKDAAVPQTPRASLDYDKIRFGNCPTRQFVLPVIHDKIKGIVTDFVFPCIRDLLCHYLCSKRDKGGILKRVGPECRNNPLPFLNGQRIPDHPGIDRSKIFRIQDENIPLFFGINFDAADTFSYRFHQAYYHV
jgi:hypothetical protein